MLRCADVLRRPALKRQHNIRARIVELPDGLPPQRYRDEDDDEPTLVDRAAHEVEPILLRRQRSDAANRPGVVRRVREELDKQKLPSEGLQAARLIAIGAHLLAEVAQTVRPIGVALPRPRPLAAQPPPGGVALAVQARRRSSSKVAPSASISKLGISESRTTGASAGPANGTGRRSRSRVLRASEKSRDSTLSSASRT